MSRDLKDRKKFKDRVTYGSEDKETIEKASGIEAIIIYIVKAGILTIAVSSVILLIAGIRNPTFLGMGIMGLGIVVYIALKMYRTVPQKQEWVIEIFERYYTTWGPGLHFLIPGFMTIRNKVTVDATKMIKLFMRGDDNKLNFEDDTAEVTVEIRARTLESYKPTYGIIYTDDEIAAIEGEERIKSNVPLPEHWMYLPLMRVEATLRGICGRMKLDDAIKLSARKTETGSGVTTESEFNKDISRNVENVVNAALKYKYAIDVEEILILNIKLHKDTEEARRKIHIAEKGIKVEEQVVLQEEQRALQEEKKGEGIINRLDAIIRDTPLTRSHAMDFEIAKEEASKVKDITVIRTGDGKGTFSKIGAEFGVGFGARYKERDKKRGDED
ncbi:MAG: Regulator of protease activity HflC, stomatin/prohibitin superfamily [Candidatus Methanocomedens sp.]|nr:MAG: Regulator of protease activity HflC, stomatin/prohibitin superfamily [ANME-2 cluster archaeon]